MNNATPSDQSPLPGAELVRTQDGLMLTFNSKPVHLPGGATLTLHAEPLARAICQEWKEATAEKPHTKLTPQDLKLTRIAATMLERIAPHRERAVGMLLAWADTDLLCYRAETPAELTELEARLWDPILDWFAATYSIRMETTSGIAAVTRTAETTEKLTLLLNSLSDAELAALGVAVPACGSLVLGLALIARHIGPEMATRLASVDESFQMARWGEDPDILKKITTIQTDLDDAMHFLTLASE